MIPEYDRQALREDIRNASQSNEDTIIDAIEQNYLIVDRRFISLHTCEGYAWTVIKIPGQFTKVEDYEEAKGS